MELIAAFVGGLLTAFGAVVLASRWHPPAIDAHVVARLQSELFCLISGLKREVIRMSDALKALTEKVAMTVSVMDSAATLIAGLAQQIRDNATDPEALMALAADLDKEQKELSDAIVNATQPETPPLV